MTYILNPSRCPSCFETGFVRLDAKRCTSCNRDLFRADDSITQFEHDTALKGSWVWFEPAHKGYFRGWVHATKLHDPRPNEEFVLSSKPPPRVETPVSTTPL